MNIFEMTTQDEIELKTFRLTVNLNKFLQKLQLKTQVYGSPSGKGLEALLMKEYLRL